jgi:diguanylate cyclase (GGDEF)-like protein/PAS domain S-box-containing protein
MADELGLIRSWNRAAVELFGYTAAAATGRPLTTLVSEPDRSRLMAELETPLAGEPDEDGRTVELRCVRDSGEEFPAVLSIATWRAESRPLLHVFVYDLSQSKRMEESLRKYEHRLRLLDESSPVGIFQTDVDGLCLYANARWREIAGLSLGESLGEGWVRSIHPDDRARVFASLSECAAQRLGTSGEFRMVTPQGDIREVHARTMAMLSEELGHHGYLGTVEDVTERKRADRELARTRAELEKRNLEVSTFVWTDALTGLGTRRRFDEMIELEWRRAERTSTPIALALLDVDRFKEFNDRLGHPRGDEALRLIAGVLKTSLHRGSDFAARYGGQEFVTILPGMNLPETAAFVDRLRKQILALGVESGLPGYPLLAVSAGVASTIPKRGLSAGILVAAANRALLRAKHEGGNAVRKGYTRTDTSRTND